MAEFDVKTISCSSKITAKIEVNISSLEHEYDGNKLEYRKIFTIDSGKGSNYTAKFCIYDFGQQKQLRYAGGDLSPFHQKGFTISIAEAQTLYLELDTKIVSSETISKNFRGNAGTCSFLDGERKTRNAQGIRVIMDDLIPEKFKSFKGDITVKFEPGSQMILKEKFKNFVNSHLVFKSDEKEENFQIVCQGEAYGFNKSILCKISPVFERMLTNPGFSENKDGLTEMKNTNPKTIEAFKNILSLDYIEKEELSIELLVFADKYDIAPLYKLCQDYFCTAISKENIYDVIKAANDTKDDELMSKAAEFIKMNPGTIEENPEWDDFFNRNPECGIKILKLNMFLKK